MKKILIITILAFVAMVLAACSENNNTTGAAVCNDPTGCEVSSNSVSIPLDDLSDQAQFFEYVDNGVKIKYFAVLGSDGEVRTAFDACDVCGGSKGYEQVGTDIKCRNCGKVFKIDGLGSKNKGYGCWPSFLPHTVNDGQVIIQASDLQSGSHRFA
jgi:uncharacterized membrane protein